LKFIFDRNWSPHLARAIASLATPDGHEIRHLADDSRFTPTASDIEWINAFADEGGWAIVTKDRLRKGSAEGEALRRTGLLVFIFTGSWSHAAPWDQAAALVRWWPTILTAAKTVSSGAFEVPYKLGKPTAIRQAYLPRGARSR
jgi:hypothetical protein